MRTLYVGGLPPEFETGMLRKLFGTFGQLADARVIMRSTTGRCRGFGYVTFQLLDEANVARSALDGLLLEGGRLRVAEAR